MAKVTGIFEIVTPTYFRLVGSMTSTACSALNADIEVNLDTKRLKPFACTVIPFKATLSTTFGSLLDCFGVDFDTEFTILHDGGRSKLRSAKVSTVDFIGIILSRFLINWF